LKMSLCRVTLLGLVGLLLVSCASLAQNQKKEPPQIFEGGKDSEAAKPLEVGTPAPEFEVKDFGGKTVTLADFAGKYLVLVFWATTGDEPKWLVEKLKDYSDFFQFSDNLALFGIAAQRDPSEVPQFLKENDLGFFRTGYAEDASVIHAYKSTRLPLTYVIDPDGVIIAAFPNYSSEKMGEIVAFLTQRGIKPNEEKIAESARQKVPEAPARDQAALDTLRAVADVYKGADAFKYTSEVAIDYGGKEPIKQTRNVTAMMRKPNLLRAEIEVDSEKLGTLVCDGKSLWEYHPDTNEYIRFDAPASLSEPTDSRLMGYIGNVFYHDDPYETMLSQIETLSFGGEAKTPEGTLCKVFIQDYGERGLYRVFVDAKTNLVIRVEGEIKGAGPGGSTVTLVERRSCEVNPQLADDTFKFVAPEGAKETKVVPGPRIIDTRPEKPESGGGEGGQ
jgi:outer membrane lipoprotein-sorting protein/peroxiredoxin